MKNKIVVWSVLFLSLCLGCGGESKKENKVSDFSISLSTGFLNLQAGSSSGLTISATGTDPNLTVNLEADGIPSGITVGFGGSLKIGGTQSVVIAASSAAQPGTSRVLIRGTAGTLIREISLNLTVSQVPPSEDDFRISVSSSPLTIPRGTSRTIAVSTTSIGGPLSVDLSIESPVPTITGSFEQANLTSGGATLLTVTPAGQTPPGRYTLTVKGTAGEKIQSTTLVVEVTAETPVSNFALGVSSDSLILMRGNSVPLAVSTILMGGPLDVTLSLVSPVPTISGTFDPPTVASGRPSLVSVTVRNDTPPGVYKLAVLGTSGSLTQSVEFTLVVTAEPLANDLAVGISVPSVSVQRGTDSIPIAVSTTAIGTPLPTELSLVSPIPTITGSIAPSTLNSGGAAVLIVKPGVETPAGLYTLTVMATSGTISRSVSLQVNVTAIPPPDDYFLSVTPNLLSIEPGGAASATITALRISGLDQNVVLTSAGAPLGMGVSFGGVIATGGNQTVSVSTTSSVATGTYPVTITGTGTVVRTTVLNVVVNAPPPLDNAALSVSPSSVSVQVGSSVNSTLSASVVTGNNQTIAPTSSGAPTGMTVTFGGPISTGGTQTVVVNTASNLVPGTYQVTISGVGNGTGSVAPTTLTIVVTSVPQPDSTALSVSPSSVSVQAGGNGAVTIGANLVSGSSQTITLSSSGAPEGVTLTFGGTVSTGSTQSGAISVSASVLAGTYPITISGTGTSNGSVVSTTLTLVVTNLPGQDDFSLTVNPATVALRAGSSGAGSISAARVSGADQTVALTSSGAPSGLTVTFGGSVATGGNQTITLAAAPNVPAGSYQITVTGTGSVVRTAVLTVVVSTSSPGQVCAADAECAPAVCLPLQSGQTTRVCSYFEFALTISQPTTVECYNGSGAFTRSAPNVAANTPFRSNMQNNEASCVALGLNQTGQCTQSSVMNGSGPCSLTIHPGHSTATWNNSR